MRGALEPVPEICTGREAEFPPQRYAVPNESGVDNEQTTTPEPLGGIQGEGGAWPPSRAIETLAESSGAVRRSPQSDHVDGRPSLQEGQPGLCLASPGGGSGTAQPAVDLKALPRQDRRADAGERFFGGMLGKARFVERKAMIDPRTNCRSPTKRKPATSAVAVSTICHVRCRTPTSRSCGVSTGCIWSSLSRARGCCKACWSLRGTRSARRHVKTLMKRMEIEALDRRSAYDEAGAGTRSRKHRTLTAARELPTTRPNQVWAMDITYIPMARGFVYLAVVLDWFSRRVLSWRLSITMEAAFCVEHL